MTIKVNHLTGSTYYPNDDQNQWAAAEPNGTKSGLAVTAHSPNNLSVDVALGTAFYNGLFMNSDSTVNVLIGSNTSGYGRIDSIAADMDNSIITAVQGTPSASPAPPILTGNKLLLAYVTVGNNVSSIVPGNIQDMRSDVPILADCNGLSTNAGTGFYVCIAGTTVNIPLASANGGVLIHIGRIGKASQLYIDFTNNIMYLRSFNGSTWSAWEQVATNVQKDSWHTISSFLGTWAAYLTGTYGLVRYIKDEAGVVHLSGMLCSGTTGTAAFNLPAGYRPGTNENHPSIDSAGAARVLVYAAGNVELNGAGVGTWVTLNGVHFVAEA